MKAKIRFLFVVAGILAMLVSACGAVTAETAGGGSKPRAALVEFTGVIEAIDGNQWTVNGQVITVDPSVLRDGQFMVGDTIKVEAEVQADGSVVVTRVELPASAINDNSNDSNSNDDNSNDSISNDDNANGDNSNDDDANENASHDLGGKKPGSSSNSNDDDDDSHDDDSDDDDSHDDNDDDSDDDDGDDD